MKYKISIIVPIYKVEDYIDRCVMSLIKQTYKNIEIILVDDGSPDNCPLICDKYEQLDSRIIVIHKKNGGLSDARNEGIKKATGDYIMFVDSDDYIELDSCKKFMDIIGDKDIDIVIGNARIIHNEEETYMKHSIEMTNGVLDGKEYLKSELKSNSMFMAVWLNIYKRKFLIGNNLKFETGLLHEDEEFTPRVFLKAEKVIGTNCIFYNYIIRDDSITTKKDLSRNAIDIIKTCYKLSDIYSKILDSELKDLLNDSLAVNYLNAFQIGKLYKNEYKNFINKKFPIKHAYAKKTLLKSLLFLINKYVYYGLNKITKYRFKS